MISRGSAEEGSSTGSGSFAWLLAEPRHIAIHAFSGGERVSLLNLSWLPPRDSNPDMLIQSQLSCR
jgi:hypothetical protein